MPLYPPKAITLCVLGSNAAALSIHENDAPVIARQVVPSNSHVSFVGIGSGGRAGFRLPPAITTTDRSGSYTITCWLRGEGVGDVIVSVHVPLASSQVSPSVTPARSPPNITMRLRLAS